MWKQISREVKSPTPGHTAREQIAARMRAWLPWCLVRCFCILINHFLPYYYLVRKREVSVCHTDLGKYCHVMFNPCSGPFLRTVRGINKRKLLESVSCVLWLPSPWAQMSTGKVKIKLEEIKTHFVFQALVIKNSCCRWVLKLCLLPLIIKQKQNATKIETNAEICSGFFFCVPMFLLVKSHYGASITMAYLSRPQGNY